MKSYQVYFEVFGKKMQTTITANNEDEAKQEIIKKIKFVKVEEKPGRSLDDVFDDMMDIINKIK